MAAGELGVWLSLRGRAEMVAGLREVGSGVRSLTRGLKETGAQAVVTDREVTRLYRREHLAGFRSMSTGLGGMHSGLTRLVAPLAAVSRALVPIAGFASLAGIAIGLRAGVDEATKLQTALGQLNTEAGVSKTQLGALGAGARTVAASTGIRASRVVSDELFHLEGTFNKAGHPLANTDALHMARVIGQGAQIGTAPVDDVAKAYSGLSVTGIAGANGSPEQLMGKLLAIVGAGGTMRMGDLASAVGSGLVPNLKHLGLNLDQVGGALATMTDNGVPAETAIRTLTTSMMHVQKPTGMGTKMLAALGMGQLQLASDLRKPDGLIVMLRDLQGHLDRLPGGAKGTQAQDVIASIFGGSKGTGPVQLLLDQLPNLSANVGKVASSTAETFTASWDTASKTFAVQKSRLVETSRNAASGVGAALLPFLGRMTGGMASFIGDATAGPATVGGSRLDRANGSDAPPSNGTRVAEMIRGIRAGNSSNALLALGLSGSALTVAEQGVRDIRGLLSDSGRILTQSVLPVFTQVALLSGGAIGVGLHLLKDVTGFLADHSTTTKALLYGFLAVIAARTIGNGLSTLAQLPVRIGAGFGRVGTTIDGLSHPLAGFQQGMRRTAGTVDESTGRMRRSLGGLTRSLTGGSGALGVLGIAGSAFGGYEVGKSSGKGAGIATGALGGAAAGSMLGPAGAVAGGVIGGLAGFIGGLHKSTTSLYDFGSAIDADKGKVGTNTQKSLLDALSQQNPQTLAFLKLAGISGDALTGIVQRDRGDRSAESRDLLAATTNPGIRAMVKEATNGGYLGTGIGARNGADQVFKPVLDVLTKLGNDLTLYGDKQSYASTFTPGNVVPARGPAVPTGPPGIGRMTARASGGPVGVGTLYPVNELGTELFAPSRPGTIIPANTSAAMAGAAAARGQGLTWTGDLVINPTPGMDERALAKAAVAEMVRVISDTAARH